MENQELMVLQNQEARINLFASKDAFELGQRMAKVFAESTLVPKQYQGNIGNCLIGLNIASRMGADPLMVFQNLVIVHNIPTFEAKFAIACFNATGKYTTIKYTEEGKRGEDSWGYRAYAIELKTGEVAEGPLVTIKMAKDEGWYAQNPKWRNIPELMLKYRAASWFIRTTDPGVMMGFQTREEAEDFTDYEEVPVDEPEVPTDAAAQQEAEEQANRVAVDMPDNDATTAQPEKKEEAKPVAPAAPTEKKNTKPIGEAPTPDIFKEQ